MRSNNTLYEFAPVLADGEKRKPGRPRKYGDRIGSVDECGAKWKAMAQTYTAFLYGKQREVLAYSRTVMLKTMKCPVRIVWVEALVKQPPFYTLTKCHSYSMTTEKLTNQTLQWTIYNIVLR